MDARVEGASKCVNDFETPWFGIYTRFSDLTFGGSIHTSVGLSGGIGALFTKRWGFRHPQRGQRIGDGDPQATLVRTERLERPGYYRHAPR